MRYLTPEKKKSSAYTNKLLEVSNIQTILTVVQQTCTELEAGDDRDASIYAKLRELLLEADTSFHFFDGLVQKILPDEQNRGTGQRDKVSWSLWMRERNDIQIHSRALRDINRKIMEVMTTLKV